MQTVRVEEVSSVKCPWWWEQVRSELWYATGQLSIKSLKDAREKTGMDTRTAFKFQKQGLGQLLGSILIDLPRDHSPQHPGLSMDRTLWEREVEASAQQENVSGRPAQDTLLPRYICDRTLLSPSQILQLLVPCRATSVAMAIEIGVNAHVKPSVNHSVQQPHVVQSRKTRN